MNCEHIMKILRTFLTGTVLGALLILSARWTSAVDKPPQIASFSKPAAGSLEIIFHGSSPPFLVQTRKSLDATAPWVDMPNALVSEVQPGVYIAWLPNANETDLGFFRIISEGEGGSELNGWTMLLRTSAPANGTHFVVGEAPTVTVTILDTMATGLTRDDFSTLNLYAYGPQDPQKTISASKLLNVTTNRSASIHHYINLKSSPGVVVSGTQITYQLKPVTTEEPGTYTIALNVVRASNQLEQVMKFANIQIGTPVVEQPVVTKDKCAACHEGTISGKIYMHHIDPSGTSLGSWGRDFQPVTSCKACHNNDGYAAVTLPNGTKSPDAIVKRAHGIHFGAELALDANKNSTNGVFRNYTDVEFPADIRDCTKCHVDDRWKTKPSQMACGACHDNIWFGQEPAPVGYLEHEGGLQADDSKCAGCHIPDPTPLQQFASISENHKIKPANMDAVDISLSPPANGKYYVAGEKPVVTVVIKDDTGKPVDHTKVTDANYSTASLFVYGPRARAVPVLTSTAKNVNAKLRASVSSSIAGPWPIKGKVFKIGINGTPAQSFTITGASNLVTAAEFCNALNPIITNLNGGCKATVSGTGVNIKSIIQGAQARIEIYNGDVTTAMGWKRGPNTILEPDVTIAAGTTPANDLRVLSDPLDYMDPKVTRNTTNITYQLDDVAGLPAGTYGIYSYQLPKAGKVPNMAAPTGIGQLEFQIGSTNIEKHVATNCKSCHEKTTFHLSEGPIHPAPFDTDYCTACHDYGHVASGDMFKNQGGTSLAGWSGFGAMPIVRRVHGVHRGAYLEHPEEIYANATKDTFGHIIFPQDIRNCTKCHAESTTWKEKPSRMACLACHDSTDAKMHGLLMTFMADPNDPYGPGSWETCVVCHGKDSAFSADKVHAISNPYVPPYPRE